jgi:DNA repair exonuclease SbcCD nuclease subunit
MEVHQIDEKNTGTNCEDCEHYKKLGEVCVIEHGKRFLWEFCKDFIPETKLPEYDELMRTVKLDMALERRKIREKKKKEIAMRKKEREMKRREKIRLKRSKIAKKIWKKRKNEEKGEEKRDRGESGRGRRTPAISSSTSKKAKDSSGAQPKIPRTASSAKATV